MRVNVEVKQERLGNLAEIRTGYPFRGRIDRANNGNCMLVQLGDVRASALDVASARTRVLLPEGPGKHLLRSGDVLFTARGERSEAATFMGKEGDTIAASHLFVLRMNIDVLHPFYLTWFLNLPQTQRKIGAMRRGSGVPFVPMSLFAEMEVPLPSVERQEQIARVHELSRVEESLTEEIKERRRALIDAALMAAVGQSGPCGPSTTNEQA